jgi:hypothetical protein
MLRQYAKRPERATLDAAGSTARHPGTTSAESDRATVIPGVLLNALPKSASTYISEMLIRGLGARRSFLTVGVFPGDLLLFERMQSFARGGQVAQQHFPASPENLAYLRKFERPFIVHARDPRAVIVSWTHHLACAPGGMRELFWYYPSLCPPEPFLERSFTWQLDWCLENHFAHFTAWLEGWCDAAQAGTADPLFTTFERFVTARPEFTREVLRKAGIQEAAFTDPGLVPGPAHLFRHGCVDEWRSVLTSRQAWQATERMPSVLWQKFGWAA